MKTSSLAVALLAGVSFAAAAEAATIRVPIDAATIQQAIDASAAGDTVVVSPGTYVENLTFRGKAIRVVSEQGPAVTVIDGNRAGSVVTFSSGETRNAVLEGFTVRNGANAFSGGGVLIQNSAPTVLGNWILNNGACSGAGIYSYFSSPLIKGNTISRNYVYACSGASGLGVYVGGDSAAELIENVITENSGFADGGGVTLFAAGRAVLRSNVIARNVTSGFSPCTSGGGIWMVNFSQATIVNNLVVGNVAGCGGGLYWGGSTGVTTFANNTFADNDAAEGSAIDVSGVDGRHLIANNLIIGKAGQTAFYCRNSTSTPPPVVSTSDVWTPQGFAFGGTCLDQTGLRGNLSANPLFARNAFADVAGDYHLQMGSPAIDAGDDTARVDMGAYEYTNQAPVAAAGADQTVTADGNCSAIVRLDGGASSDADGDPLTFTWSGPFGTMSGAATSVSLPAGTHVITLTVRDGRGGSSSDTLVVTVVDATAPAITSAVAVPSVLSPANHQFVAVAISVSAVDGCGGPVRCRITSVTSNEPLADDWIITGDLTLKLRAERLNKGTGRVYTITIVCTDRAGNEATKTVTVSVPR
jgi:hypothetical protein